MHVVPTELAGVLVIEPDVYRDDRGFFLETYHVQRYSTYGVDRPFVQDNHSRSVGGTLRGLHLQAGRPQAKLVRVVSGAIYDVAVDVRRGSPTFGRWVAVELSADNFKQCYIPAGFAHGFVVLSSIAEVEYKCSELYAPALEIGVAWNDPDLGIPWPIENPVLSDRDKSHPRLTDQQDRLPVYLPNAADIRHPPLQSVLSA